MPTSKIGSDALAARSSAAADDLFPLAHHDQTGRPLRLLRLPALGVCLAAVLIAELMLTGHVLLQGDALVVMSPTPLSWSKTRLVALARTFRLRPGIR
jgi:hypothetical protein